MLWYCSGLCETESGVDHDVAAIQIKNATLPDLMKCMALFFKKFREFDNSMKSKNLENIKLDVKKIQTENQARDLQIEKLKNEIGQLKQSDYNRKMICYNVGVNEGSTAMESLKTYLNENNMTCESAKNIQSCNILKQKKTGKAAMVINFDNDDSKLKFISDIRNFKKCNKSIKIKVMEMLAPEVRELLQEAKSTLEKRFKYIWTKNGKIYIRKDDNENAIMIRNSSDIRRLINTQGE